MEDFSDIFNNKCAKLGATIVSHQDFLKFANERKEQFRPDMIIWSEGDQQIVEAAEKFAIPIVNLQWLHEYAVVTRCETKLVKPDTSEYLLTEREKHMSFDNKRTSMKAMRTKLKEPSVDIVEAKVPKRAQKPKKLTELGKIAQTSQKKELSEFVDQMANTLKEFEKMDPSLKNMIRDIFSEKPEVGATSSRSVSIKSTKNNSKVNVGKENGGGKKHSIASSSMKPKKISVEAIEEVDKFREHSNGKSLPQRDNEKKTALSKSGMKLQQEYKYVIGYHGKWNAVKAFKLLKDDLVFFIKGGNLISVQNKINLFVTDGSHKGSLVILYCIMNSIPIIKMDWITDSVKQGTLLDPENYKLELDLNHKIFEKLNIAIYKEPAKAKQSMFTGDGETSLLEDAVRRFGGTVKNNHIEADYLVVIDSYLDKFTSSKNKKDATLQHVVNYKWVVDCILENFKKNPINPIYDIKQSN